MGKGRTMYDSAHVYVCVCGVCEVLSTLTQAQRQQLQQQVMVINFAYAAGSRQEAASRRQQAAGSWQEAAQEGRA